MNGIVVVAIMQRHYANPMESHLEDQHLKIIQYSLKNVRNYHESDVVLGPLNEPIDISRVLWLTGMAATMPVDGIINFLGEKSFVLINSNDPARVMKYFFLINEIIKLRPEIGIENFSVLIKEILKVSNQSRIEIERYKGINDLIITAILVPLCVRASSQTPVDEETFGIAGKHLARLLENSSFTYSQVVRMIMDKKDEINIKQFIKPYGPEEELVEEAVKLLPKVSAKTAA